MPAGTVSQYNFMHRNRQGWFSRPAGCLLPPAWRRESTPKCYPKPTGQIAMPPTCLPALLDPPLRCPGDQGLGSRRQSVDLPAKLCLGMGEGEEGS